MKEYSLNVLEQYDIEVNSTRKVRGAILCDTKQGVLLLMEAAVSEKKAPVLGALTTHIASRGYQRVDSMFINKEGAFISKAEDGTRYVLKRWFAGRECDVKKESEILESARNLARLHNIMKMPDEEWKEFRGNDLNQEYLRHNREMKKVRTFIRNKTNKGAFENVVLQNFDKMYEWANNTQLRLTESEYAGLCRRSEEDGTIIHGDYNHHNVIITPHGLATTGFEHCYMDIQAADLYYFMRKMLEKYQWNIELGRAILRAYQEIHPLEEEELDYIAIRLSYPEKFWKIMNSYYHSNKAWIPEKNVEKLCTAISQIEEKRRFLNRIFALQL